MNLPQDHYRITVFNSQDCREEFTTEGRISLSDGMAVIKENDKTSVVSGTFYIVPVSK